MNIYYFPAVSWTGSSWEPLVLSILCLLELFFSHSKRLGEEKSSVREVVGETSRDASLDALPDFLVLRVRSLMFWQVSI